MPRAPLMFNIHERTWDPDLLHFLDIPLALLPQVVPSAHVAGRTEPAIVGAGRSHRRYRRRSAGCSLRPGLLRGRTG